MNRVLKQSLSLLTAGIIVIGTAACLENISWADRLNFYDGKTEDGHIVEISGDLVRYRKGWLHEFSTSRLRLTDRQDTVTIWGDKKFTGEIHYIDSAKLELLTDTGTRIFWKAMVKDIQLGSPKLPSIHFTPASSRTSDPTSPSSAPDMTPSMETNGTTWAPEPQPEPNFSASQNDAPKRIEPKQPSETISKPRVSFPED